LDQFCDYSKHSVLSFLVLVCLELMSCSVIIVVNSLEIFSRFATDVKAADENTFSNEVVDLYLEITWVAERSVLILLVTFILAFLDNLFEIV
jgi:hypothetical protein